MNKIKIDPRTGKIIYQTSFKRITTEQDKKDNFHQSELDIEDSSDITLLSKMSSQIADLIISKLSIDLKTLSKNANIKSTSNYNGPSIDIDESLIDVGLENQDSLSKGNEAKKLGESLVSEDKDFESTKNKLRNLKRNR